MVCNLRRARQKWAQLTRVLRREGADARTSGKIYWVVVKLVLLYGSETRVLTLRMHRVMGGFHHRVAYRLMGWQPWKGRDGGWVYPHIEDAMTKAGLQEVDNYISCRQKTVAQYIATRPIIDLCLAESGG